MPLKSYTLADIRQLKPCYDPATKVPEDWAGTVADILRLENVPAEDRIWVAARLEGTMIAAPDDWGIKGVKGEVYSCKPGVFAMTYEPVEDDK